MFCKMQLKYVGCVYHELCSSWLGWWSLLLSYCSHRCLTLRVHRCSRLAAKPRKVKRLFWSTTLKCWKENWQRCLVLWTKMSHDRCRTEVGSSLSCTSPVRDCTVPRWRCCTTVMLKCEVRTVMLPSHLNYPLIYRTIMTKCHCLYKLSYQVMMTRLSLPMSISFGRVKRKSTVWLGWC